MRGKTNLKISLIVAVLLVGMGLVANTNICKSDDAYIVLDDMEDYNDRDDIREVWTDGYATVDWGIPPSLPPITGGSSGSNLNVSTAVGSPLQGNTGPIHGGDQAMVLRYDNDGWTYTGLPGEEKWIYDAPYFSEIEANTVGTNSLDIGQDWAGEGFKSLTMWFQGHPISDGFYDTSMWPAYKQTGRGRDIGGRHDEFHFFGKYPLTTPGTVQVQVLAIEDTNPWSKAGVMIREKWTPYSKFAAVFMTPGNGVTFQWRENEDGASTSINKPGVTTPQYVKLERTISGNFIAKHSDDGMAWYDVNAPGQAPVQPLIPMGTEDPNLYIGTAVTSHDALATCTADFYDVLMSPSPTSWVTGNIGTNDAEQLYVALSDGVTTAVVNHPNPNAATLTEWQEWNIELTEFTGVDFNSVQKVYIGLGDRDVPVRGGSGTVYIDVYKRGPLFLFVDAGAPEGGNGSSWADAFINLQDALAVSIIYGDDIFVAQGTYKPDQGSGQTLGDRTATFQLINDVAIYGGYAGFGEPDPNARDIVLYETILSGDLSGDDGPDFANNGENSYHVVTGSGTNATAILDGFTITAGNASEEWPSSRGYGGGMHNYHGSPTLTNCTFSGNSAGWEGGGMFNFDSNPVMTNCTFSGNLADYDGGGMYNAVSSSPTVTNCTFSDNSASREGGGMYNYGNSTPTLTNCTFSSNSAAEGGGGMYNLGSNPALTNCRFSGNSAGYGGAVYNLSSSSPTLINCTFSANSASDGGNAIGCDSQDAPSTVQLVNCILWDGGDEIWNNDASTIMITYSDVQGGYPGLGNINADPMFKDADGPDDIFGTEDDNLELAAGSPCIDAGDNTEVPADTVDLDEDGNTSERTPLDLGGNARFTDDPLTDDTGVPATGYPEIVEMGAYERYEFCGDAGHPFPVGDVNRDCKVNFLDIAIVAAHWLEDAGPE